MLTLMEMVVNGVSTHKISRITEELCDTEFSKSTVSDLCKKLYTLGAGLQVAVSYLQTVSGGNPSIKTAANKKEKYFYFNCPFDIFGILKSAVFPCGSISPMALILGRKACSK